MKNIISVEYLHWIFRYLSFEGRHGSDVGLVEPLDPEVAVEVGGGLAEPVNGVILQRVLDVDREQGPDGAG